MPWVPPRQPNLEPCRPCVMLRDPDSDHQRCGAQAGARTILDFPICDDCYLDVTGEAT